ncbi:MAG: hypothetical protein PHV82_10325 [Victivallaceae bacterium]|nr:hypothetical protein [Victivallaceae bacterium]
MGKDVSKNSPGKSQEAAQNELIARIDQLEKMLIHTKQKRVAQSIVVWTCTAIIIAVCAWFLISFSQLVANYDTGQLVQGLRTNSDIIIKSPQFRGVVMDMQDIFVPAYKEALLTELNAKGTNLQAAADNELSELKKLFVKKLQDGFISEIHKDFEKVEKDLLARYPDLNADKMDEVYTKASEMFVEKISVSLNRFVKEAVNKLAGLDETFRQFKNEQAYKDLNKKSVQEVESLLLESLLELWIYELNPEKGGKPVEAQGGKLAKRNK